MSSYAWLLVSRIRQLLLLFATTLTQYAVGEGFVAMDEHGKGTNLPAGEVNLAPTCPTGWKYEGTVSSVCIAPSQEASPRMTGKKEAHDEMDMLAVGETPSFNEIFG